MTPVYINGDLSMNLKAKNGGNQEGLCFVSSETSLRDPGVFEIHYNDHYQLIEVRPSDRVPSNLIVLDERVFIELGCSDNSEITLDLVNDSIPICKNLCLSVTSTKNLDNQAVADAISKRVNDLRGDFNGLILRVGQVLSIDRLGIKFNILSLNPMSEVHSAARISWDVLDEICLEPRTISNIYNLCCIIEIGAAAHIADVADSSKISTSSSVPRYEASLAALMKLSENFSGYGTEAQFCGFAYSDEVIQYPLYNSETGESILSSSIHSLSLFASFAEWVRKALDSHKGKPSNPGEMLSVAIETASTFHDVNDYPTIVLFCSSGAHTAGPNPVKVAKNHLNESNLILFSLSVGKDSKLDLMEAIIGYTQGTVLNVTDLKQIEVVPSLIFELLNQVGDP